MFVCAFACTAALPDDDKLAIRLPSGIDALASRDVLFVDTVYLRAVIGKPGAFLRADAPISEALPVRVCALCSDGVLLSIQGDFCS